MEAETEVNFDAQVALHGYNERFLECRDLRHPWALKGCFRVNGQIRRVLTCTRCETERIDVWLNNGERVSASYNYPDGYQLLGGRVRPIDVRKESLSRITRFGSEREMIQSVITRKSQRAKGG